MANSERPSVWEKIQRNVQEAERLIGQKKYNLSMIKVRQTLEFMVKLQCDKAGIVESSLDVMIKELYEGQWIKKSTAEHYLQILSIGNKAAQEGNDSAGNANQAYHLLSQEVYNFADEGKSSRRRSAGSRQEPQSRSRKKQERSALAGMDLMKLLIPVVLVIVLIFLIRVLAPKKTTTNETSTAPTTTEQLQTETTAPVETVPETTAPVVYKTKTTLNVRKEPSTDAARVGKLDPDVTVEYVRDHDDKWAVIMYNNQEAYVAKEYLVSAGE